MDQLTSETDELASEIDELASEIDGFLWQFGVETNAFPMVTADSNT